MNKNSDGEEDARRNEMFLSYFRHWNRPGQDKSRCIKNSHAEGDFPICNAVHRHRHWDEVLLLGNEQQNRTEDRRF